MALRPRARGRRHRTATCGDACGRCDNCAGIQFDVSLDPAAVGAANAFLRRSKLEIQPRRQWPTGLAQPRGRISVDCQLAAGRALSIYNDGGWGSFVRKAKYSDAEHRVPDDLVAAAAELVADLPFHDVVRRTRDTRPQKEMENSAQQLRNVYGAFTVVSPVPTAPVLLVDDVVDSRWTLTVIGALLRDAGVEAVHPFALAKAVSS